MADSFEQLAYDLSALGWLNYANRLRALAHNSEQRTSEAVALLGEMRRKGWGARTKADIAKQEAAPLLDRVDAFMAANGDRK